MKFTLINSETGEVLELPKFFKWFDQEYFKMIDDESYIQVNALGPYKSIDFYKLSPSKFDHLKSSFSLFKEISELDFLIAYMQVSNDIQKEAIK